MLGGRQAWVKVSPTFVRYNPLLLTNNYMLAFITYHMHGSLTPSCMGKIVPSMADTENSEGSRPSSIRKKKNHGMTFRDVL